MTFQKIILIGVAFCPAVAVITFGVLDWLDRRAKNRDALTAALADQDANR